MTEENDNENDLRVNWKRKRGEWADHFLFSFVNFFFLSFFFFPIPPLPFLGLLIYLKDQSEKGELLMA